jgi:hypothetical protein
MIRQNSLMSVGARQAALIAALILPVAAGIAGGQGTLSIQGLGFAQGQVSTRSLGAGSALAEGDPFSPVNPAAPAVFGRKFLYLQIEPEYRRVTSPSDARRSTTARYPVAFAAIPVGERFVFTIGTSSLLDRTWATAATDTTIIRDEEVVSISDHSVSGGINDLRLAGAWTNRRWLRLGLGLHGTAGRNVIRLSRVFPESSTFATFSQALTVSYTGGGASGGVEILPTKETTLSANYRYGGRIHAVLGDSLLAAGDLANRMGFGIGYTGIRGTTLAARAVRHNWSSLSSLGSGETAPVDAWDMAIGADVGARILNFTAWRGGVRTRTLPYQASGKNVRERSISGGTAMIFAGGLLLVDLAATRSFRDAGLPVKESAWTFSIGLSTRP